MKEAMRTAAKGGHGDPPLRRPMRISGRGPRTRLPAQPIRPATTLWRGAARRFFKNKLAVGALLVMVLLILVAIFAGVIAPAPYDYSVLAEANQFPNAR